MDLDEDNVIPLLVLANKYNISELEKSCELYALSLVFNGTPVELIIDWWLVAGQLNLSILRQKCQEYMILNMDMVLKSEYFLDFEYHDVLALLKERNLVVTNEITLYCAIWRWLSQESRQDQLPDYFKELMSHIKFCMMSTEQLLTIETKLPHELKCLISGQLLEAFKFHALPFDKRAKMGLGASDSHRLYTQAQSKGPSICAGIALNSDVRPYLKKGLPHQAQIPVSLSEADKNNLRDWKLVFQENEESINLEVSTATTSSEQFGMIEASVLLYKEVNSILFVKGVMQFRIFQGKSTSNGKAGHVFSVLVPPSALEENKLCVFRLITRHYHDKQLVKDILQLERPILGSSQSVKN